MDAPDSIAEVDAPELSVIIPARNEERWIGDQLRALCNQKTELPWETVVVDNGSSDSTPDIVRSFQAVLPRLRLVSEPTPGVNRARGTGVKEAQAPTLAFCDADDVVSADWVGAMIDALAESDLVTGPVAVDQLNQSALSTTRGLDATSGVQRFFGVFPYVRGNNFGVRRETLEKLGGFSSDLAALEDVELGLRAWTSGVKIGYAENAVVQYRYRDTPRALWRQGLQYGKNRPCIVARMKELGVDTPPRFAGWKSWLLLLATIPSAVTYSGRCKLAWIAGNRIGQLLGSVSARTVFL